MYLQINAFGHLKLLRIIERNSVHSAIIKCCVPLILLIFHWEKNKNMIDQLNTDLRKGS